MSNWLIYANIAVWLGLGLYLIFIAKEQNKLQKRISSLEQMDNNHE